MSIKIFTGNLSFFNSKGGKKADADSAILVQKFMSNNMFKMYFYSKHDPWPTT